MQRQPRQQRSLLPETPPAPSRPSFSRSRPSTRAQLLVTLFLAILLGTEIISNFSTVPSVHAATLTPPDQGTVNSKTVQQMGKPDTQHPHGSFVRPSSIPPTPKSSQKNTKGTPPPSVEPAKMKPVSYRLNSTFIKKPARVRPSASPTATPSPTGPSQTTPSTAKTRTTQSLLTGKPLKKSSIQAASQAAPASGTLVFKSSDGRLEVDLPADSLDLSQATLSDGSAPVGDVSLQFGQDSGHYRAERSFLGTYVIQVVDSQNNVVQGVQLLQPMTLSYHYQAGELDNLGIDPSNVHLTWPEAIIAARDAQPSQTVASSAKMTANVTPSMSSLDVSMTNDASTNTLTAQTTQLAGTATVSGEPDIQAPPTPHMASVSGNAGQLSYEYPLSFVPGPAGFTPQLSLSYSSESTNERYSNRAPAGAVGEGWNLGFGSISKQTYPSGSTAPGDWYFLSGVGNVSDRLIPDTVAGNGFYQTEHISHLRIQFTNNCWHVWDVSGSYYELGCNSSANSQQFTTDSSGTKQVNQWNLDKLIAPNDNHNQLKLMLVTYLQDVTDSGKTVRDSALKQVTYGTSTNGSTLSNVAGTIDFHYHGPSAQGTWVDAYTSSYQATCGSARTPILRCDDPIDNGGNLAPKVMSTFSLDSLTSYVGSDTSGSNKAYSYAFTYQDSYSGICYDAYSLQQEYCAGIHLLRSIVPTVYQGGTAHARQGLALQYACNLIDTYYDPYHTTTDPSQQYGGTTHWCYLSQYNDLDTGVGQSISYQTAYSNTNGTPYVINADGSVDDRHDPLYCSRHANDSDTSKHCAGVYNHPDAKAWSAQVVTQTQSLGTDSATWWNTRATTTYNYWLSVTGLNGCNPITGSGVPSWPSQTDCVGDNWIPAYNGTGTPQPDGDWADYYHAEFRGFNGVFMLSPSGNLTSDYYFSTDGWGTPQSNGGNYNRGQMYEEDVYWGSQGSDGSLEKQTLNYYTGVSGPFTTINSCDGRLNATYNPCVLGALRTVVTTYDVYGKSANAPWVQTDFTYDDINPSSGFVPGKYHNLVKQVTTSSNAPTVTKTMSYAINDQTVNGWIYYNTDKVTHAEVDDGSGHVYQCVDTAYDEGAPTGVPTPSAGLATTTTAYTNCANKTGKTQSYTGYDQFGNAVANVDAFAASHSSIYGSQGCTLSTAPVVIPAAWTNTRYTSCKTFDSYVTRTTNVQNVLGQSSGTTFDYTQSGGQPTRTTDANGQSKQVSYSYPDSATSTVQQSSPGETSGYTRQSTTKSTCTTTSTLPCLEIDTNSSLYPGAVSQTFYDGLGRPVETRVPLDATHDVITFTIHRDDSDQVFTSQPFRYPHGSGWIDPGAFTVDNDGTTGVNGTVTWYDPLGRVLSMNDPMLGTSSEPGISCHGGTWSTCDSYWLATPKGATGLYERSNHYDGNGHLISTFTDAYGRVRFVQYYGSRQVQGTDAPDSDITTLQETQYNAIGKTTASIITDAQPQPGQTTTSVTTTAQYDDQGNLTQLVDPDRGTSTYTYDDDNRQIQVTTTSGTSSRTVGTSYDLLGRAVCVQDAAPTTDGSGTCSSGSHPLVQNTYDTSTLGTAGSSDFPVGQLTKTVSTTYYPSPDNNSVTTTQQFQHDLRGQLVTSTLQYGLPSNWNVSTSLPTYKLTQAYDNNGLPTMTQTFVGTQNVFTATNAYDSTTGQLIGLSNNATAVPNVVKENYNNHGLLDSINYLNSSGTIATSNYQYDGNLRVVNSSATLQQGGSTIFANSRTYDPTGNVLSTSSTHASVPGQTGSGGSETQNFCYDELNRMVWAGNSAAQPAAGNGECGSGTLSNTLNGATYNTGYAYTHLGQIWLGPLNGTGAAQAYLYCDSSHPHQVTGIYPNGTTCATMSGATPTYNVTYDPYGNVASRTYQGKTATLAYDVSDHFVRWDSDTHEWYAYDPSGSRSLRRSTTSSGTKITVYAFGTEEHVYDGSGNHQSDTYYYSLQGRLIGKSDGTNNQFFLTDGLGSVVSSFDANGVVQGNQVYGPYGNTRYNAGSMGTDKGFTGQYQDSTGLDYFNARYYDPVIGRFLSADTVQGNMQGMDPYDYVGGNPASRTDPTGHFMVGENGEKAWNSGGNTYETVPWSSAPPVVIAVYNGWEYRPVIHPVIPPRPPEPKPEPVAKPKPAPDPIVSMLTGAGHLLVEGADQFLGISSMVNDWGTLTSSNTSTWDKVMAGGDLVMNVGMDLSMFTGFGEEARVAELVAKGGEEIAAHVTEDAMAHGAEDVAEHAAESCGGLSFSFATTVATAKGAQAIGTLKVGQKVWAYNPTTRKMELESIKHVWINHDNDLIDLAISYTTKDKQGHPVQQVDTIHTNKKHPFLTQEQGFTPVAQLIPGMHIVRADGSLGTVVAWEVVPGTSTMYNLEVDQDHTFTVSDGQWVVHNCANSIFAQGAENHIFEGGVNGRGEGTGYHWEGNPNSAGKVEGIRSVPDANGVYEARVSVNGASKGGKGTSTFFPSSWSKDGVKSAITEAYNNKTFVGGNTYIGTHSSGIQIQMFLNSADKIISAFPIYNYVIP